MLCSRLYWDTKDVLSYLAAENDDEYIKRVLAQGKDRTATDEDAKASVQGTKSVNKDPLKFENVKTTPGGHRIQVIEELQTVPVSTIWQVALVARYSAHRDPPNIKGYDRCRCYQVATRHPVFGGLALRFDAGIGKTTRTKCSVSHNFCCYCSKCINDHKCNDCLASNYMCTSILLSSIVLQT